MMISKSLTVVNQYAQLPDGPGGTRHYELLNHFPDKSCIRHLIVGSSELNTGRQRLPFYKLWSTINNDDLFITFIRTPSSIGNGPKRVWGMFQFSFLTFIFLFTIQYKNNVIYASTPQPIACLASYFYALIARKRFFLEIRDLWPESLFALGLMKRNTLAAKILSHLDLFLVNKAEKVITLISNASDFYQNKSLNKFVYIPNGISLDAESHHSQTIYPPVQDNHFSKGNTSHSNIFVFTYFGALGYANGVSSLVEASHLLSKESNLLFKLKIIGAGPEYQKIKKYIQINNLGNVELLQPVPKNKIKSLVIDDDCFIFHLRPASVFKYGISPNKLIDYMSLNKPIIICHDNWPNPLNLAGVGYNSAPMNPLNIAATMKSVMLAPKNELAMNAAQARSYVENYHSFQYLSSILHRELFF